jgi:hypothetical protein
MGRRELDSLFRVRDRTGAVVDVAMSIRNTGYFLKMNKL